MMEPTGARVEASLCLDEVQDVAIVNKLLIAIVRAVWNPVRRRAINGQRCAGQQTIIALRSVRAGTLVAEIRHRLAKTGIKFSIDFNMISKISTVIIEAWLGANPRTPVTAGSDDGSPFSEQVLSYCQKLVTRVSIWCFRLKSLTRKFTSLSKALRGDAT